MMILFIHICLPREEEGGTDKLSDLENTDLYHWPQWQGQKNWNLIKNMNPENV